MLGLQAATRVRTLESRLKSNTAINVKNNKNLLEQKRTFPGQPKIEGPCQGPEGVRDLPELGWLLSSSWVTLAQVPPAWDGDESASEPFCWELIINCPHFCTAWDSVASHLRPGTVWGTSNLGDGKAVHFLSQGTLLSLVGLFSINSHLLSFPS